MIKSNNIKSLMLTLSYLLFTINKSMFIAYYLYYIIFTICIIFTCILLSLISLLFSINAINAYLFEDSLFITDVLMYSWFGYTRSPYHYHRFSTRENTAWRQVTYPAAYPGSSTILKHITILTSDSYSSLAISFSSVLSVLQEQ